MKKFLSLILAVLLIFTLVPANVFAASADAVIKISDAEGYAGDEVSVTISLETEVAWRSIGFVVDYDEEALIYKGISYGPVAEKNVFGKENVYDPSTSMIGVGFASAEAVSGEIATLTFEISGEAEKGYNVISAEEINMKNFTAESEDGAVNVKKRNILGVGLNDKTFNYDGTEKEALVAGTIPEGGSVTYENNKAIAAGTYNVKATVKAPGYNDLELSATLKIVPAKLTLTGVSAKDKTYDGTNVAEITEGELTGVIGDDDVYAVYPENGTFASVNASATAIKVTLDEITLEGEDAGNYTLSQPSGLKAKINKAPITVTADSFELTVGDEIPELTYEITEGEVYEDDAITGSLSTNATTSAEGDFTVAKGTLKASANYILTFVPGQITVREKPAQEVSVAKLEEVVYGEFPFALEVTLGEKVTDSEVIYSSSNENVAEISEDGVITVKSAGETEITVSKAGNEEYAAFVYRQTLKVNKAVVVVNAVENQWKRVGADEPVLAYTYNNTLIDGDVFTGALTRKSGNTAGFYDILIGTLRINDNYEIIFNSAKFEIKAKENQEIEFPAIPEASYATDDFALVIEEGENISGNGYTFTSSNENVATVSADGTVSIKGTGYTYITVKKAGDEDYADFEMKQKFTVVKENITVDADEGQWKRVGETNPELTYTYEGKIKAGESFTGALTRKTGETVGLYDILIGTLKINSNYKITFNSAKFEIVDKLIQDVTVDELTEKTYGDEAFKLNVEVGSDATDSEIIFASGNEDVATIDADGNITIKNAGTTEISVTKAGNEDFADFSLVQTLKVNKAEIKIIVTPGQNKKVGSDEPVIAYTYEGTLADGDEFTGALSRKEGEDVGTYAVYVGTLDITNSKNYAVTFVSATFEITAKTPQTITLAEIPALTYGDAAYTITVTKDATSNLEAFTYESDNTAVLTIENGVITVIGAGEATITVTEPGNEEYAEAKASQKVTVAKKDVTLTALDIEAKTATIDGIVGEDELGIDFTKIVLTKGEVTEAETVDVTVSNLVLTGDVANYNLTTESFVIAVTKDKMVTLTVASDKGTVTGEGTYLAGEEVKLTAKAKSGYKFAGWYEGDTLLSSSATYTFIITEDKALTAKYKKSGGGGGGGGGGGTSYSTVKFETNGGGEIASVKVEYGKTLGEVSAPVKEGYIFSGWFLDKEFTTEYTASSKVKGNITLYAKWTVDEAAKAKKELVLTIGEVDAKVFGEDKANDVAPVIRNDRTMLPARFVAEALGATVSWNDEKREVTIEKGELKIVIVIDSDKAFIGEKEVTLDSPAFIENDRTYTPIRFIAEALGASVTWDEATQKVTITVK